VGGCKLRYETYTHKHRTHTEIFIIGPAFPNNATHCNTLQHAATHCNTLQHTATHCTTHCTTLQDAYTHTPACAAAAISSRASALFSLSKIFQLGRNDGKSPRFKSRDDLRFALTKSTDVRSPAPPPPPLPSPPDPDNLCVFSERYADFEELVCDGEEGGGECGRGGSGIGRLAADTVRT